MRFLVDAQLPRRFCVWLAEAGHDAVHTLELPNGNRTSDWEILDEELWGSGLEKMQTAHCPDRPAR